MFDGLTGRLGDIFDRLRRRGALTEEDVGAALREVRVALLEADVALPVVKSFINGVKEKAVGQEVLRSITPGQMVIKIVHDHLVEMLGEQNEGINLNAEAPVPVLMLGLQGSGKTTSTAKIARLLKTREKKKVLMASLDTRRPAAQEQLRVLGEQVDVATLPIVPGEDPVTIAQRAMRVGRLEGYDVVMLDTAGRLAIDEELMDEVVRIRDVTKPVESLLVVDAMTGQDAVTVATNFNDKVGVTGIVMTRIDGDARGGAALSMRQITGRPIKLLGTGEKIDALEAFHPDRIAGRILGMGDVLSLVEKAAETIDREEAEKLAAKMEKGNFDLDDMLSQLRQIRKMGGMGGMLSMLPGVGKIKDQLSKANIDERMLKRQEAIITSMTQKERRDIKLLNASRRRRIALGSGTTVADVNRLLKQYQDMADMMRKFKKLGKKGLMRQGLSALMPKGR
ncbi:MULTISPECIES: signal recognition particle protein [unclassified Nitrospirillum]|uniref:signal recognition particle protein n=1 Tax=unclassified Nitrospirillum TaxID=2627523 RepID=UPI002ACA1475|nr:signal recognition particle protein [Nitrospirillum sp. BR 11828]MDZ5647248.1 signal recognition particle protein [Nitrospirillum sp. BR 11828]MEE3626659.1 signal recognition particle protein [Nitrospirillum sp. BR 11752]